MPTSEAARAQKYAADVAKVLHHLRGYGLSLRPEKIPRAEVDAVFTLMSKHEAIYTRGFANREDPVYIAQEIQRREWDGV